MPPKGGKTGPSRLNGRMADSSRVFKITFCQTGCYKRCCFKNRNCHFFIDCALVVLSESPSVIWSRNLLAVRETVGANFVNGSPVCVTLVKKRIRFSTKLIALVCNQTCRKVSQRNFIAATLVTIAWKDWSATSCEVINNFLDTIWENHGVLTKDKGERHLSCFRNSDVFKKLVEEYNWLY